MAVTLQAVVGVSNSSIVNGQVVNGVVTVYNQGTTPTNVNTIQLISGSEIVNGGANSVSLGSINVSGPGMLNGLPAVSSGGVAGQVSFPFSFTAFCGIQSITPLFAFPVTALVTTSDGSFVAASTATVECVAPQSLPYQGPQLPFTPTAGPLAAVTSLSNLPGALPNTPVQGQLRLDSNLESGLMITVL